MKYDRKDYEDVNGPHDSSSSSDETPGVRSFSDMVIQHEKMKRRGQLGKGSYNPQAGGGSLEQQFLGHCRKNRKPYSH